MLAMRWGMRLMGLFSMSIIARLLAPDDFGVFAVSITLVGLLDALTDIGSDLAIIRHPNPQRQHYDTAWTLKILISSFVALLIALSAHLSNYVYADSRYEEVFYVMALSMLIGGFTNIAIADFRRNLQFHKDFQYTFLVQCLGVATTITLAFILRSYWALVLGGLARSLAGVLLSFLMHSYRPKLSLAANQELFGFSFWVMIRSLAIFLSSRGDRLVLGAYFSPAVIGWYAIASDLAQMAVFELLYPIGRALLPGMAKKQDDKEWERQNLRKIFNGAATIAIAMGFGIAALAEPVITLVYGANFSSAGPLLCILAFASAIDGFSQPVGQYLVVHDRTKELAILFIIASIVNVGLIYALASHGEGILMICYARIAVSLFSLIRVFYIVGSLQTISWTDIVAAWIRPLFAGAAMFGAVWELKQVLTFAFLSRLALDLGSPWINLLGGINSYYVLLLTLGVPLGALVYCSSLIAIWYIAGQPSGIEEEIFQRAFKQKR